jgi:hypothetical protein
MNEHLSCLRRDAEPHRGRLLKLLASLAICIALLSFCVIPGFVSLALGLAVRALAMRDLKKMDENEMDPRGRVEVETAQIWSNQAVLLCFVGLVLAFSGLAIKLLLDFLRTRWP